MGKWILTTDKLKFEPQIFCDAHYFFCKDLYMPPQKLEIAFTLIINLFFLRCIFNKKFQLLFISFSNLLAINPWSTCFLTQLSNYFWIMKQDLSSSLFFVSILHGLLVYYNLKYNTWHVGPLDQPMIFCWPKKMPKLENFYHEVSILTFVHAICS